jgi:hypothetical protein
MEIIIRRDAENQMVCMFIKIIIIILLIIKKIYNLDIDNIIKVKNNDYIIFKK